MKKEEEEERRKGKRQGKRFESFPHSQRGTAEEQRRTAEDSGGQEQVDHLTGAPHKKPISTGLALELELELKLPQVSLPFRGRLSKKLTTGRDMQRDC